MRLKNIVIQNVKGIEFLEIKAGAMTVLSGGNGVGKSSVLDGVSGIFKGGHDASLIRLGQKRAEVVLTLDDGTTITKTVTPSKSTLKVETKDGQPIKPEKEFVDSLAEGFAFNPFGLMTADPKKRQAFLLEVLPLSFSGEEIAAAIGWAAAEQRIYSLDELQVLRDGLYKSRTAANTSARDAEGTVKSLNAALPDEDGKDWQAALVALDAERTDIEGQITDAEKAAAEACSADEAEIVRDITDRIAALQQEKESRLQVVREVKAAKLKKIADVAKPERDRLAGECATARANATAQAKAAGARESINAMRAKVRRHFEESERLTAQIEALDDLRKRKMDSLPIEGVTVVDGEMFVDGVKFDQLNTAGLAALCIRLARLNKSGSLPFMVADRSECFDAEVWPDLCEAVEKAGIQVLAARVTDGPLKVEALAST
jgi:hypothetical protein